MKYTTYNFDLIDGILDKYYEVLPNLMKKLERSKSENFMIYMCPSFRGTDKD